MAKPGDRVKINTKPAKEQRFLRGTNGMSSHFVKGSEEGILMPSPDQDSLLLKLDNGYNIGFEKKEVTKISVMKKKAEKKKSPSKIVRNPLLPTIAVLHTGGTIASKVDYRTGGVAAEFAPEELISLFPELQQTANVESELIAQMWSDDLRFAHFSLIAAAIKRQVQKGVKGIIVGMGTDNLAVAAAALSFIVEKSPVPIILVGAQRSSDRGSSDAAMNLICAAEFVTKTDFGGVAICMHEHASDAACAILPAGKTCKLHSSRRDAFRAVNSTALARVDYQTRKITFLQNEYPKRAEKLVLKPKMEDKVSLLKVHINMFPKQFSFFKGCKGLIIEGTGLGHTPGQAPNKESAIHKKIYPAIKKLVNSGCVVVMTTQCLFGSVNMNVYDKGRDLMELGIVSGKDMLANTALVKLSWLLANYPRGQVKKLMAENLRGEINERLQYEEDFVKS